MSLLHILLVNKPAFGTCASLTPQSRASVVSQNSTMSARKKYNPKTTRNNISSGSNVFVVVHHQEVLLVQDTFTGELGQALIQ